MFSWITITALIFVFVFGSWWFLHARAREGAIAAVKAACRRHNYQLLDGAMQLKRVRCKRSFPTTKDEMPQPMQWCVHLMFVFDYYDGENRCRGKVFWQCGKLDHIEFVAAQRQVEQQKVVNLDDYR